MVKRLRHHPFTVVSRVRIPVGSPTSPSGSWRTLHEMVAGRKPKNKPVRLREDSCPTGTKLPQSVARGLKLINLSTLRLWKYSSVGRASALQAGGHRFEPCYFHHNILILGYFNYGLVVQLVRMPPCHGGGRGFESHLSRHLDFNRDPMC